MTRNLTHAICIALKAHDGQMRKEAPIPYITHPIQVALILASYGFPDYIIAAALTHDVLEDSDVTPDELEQAIGTEALAIVKAVTNDDSLSWEDKKKTYIQSVQHGPEGTIAVAVADKVHNLESLLEAYAQQGSEIWKHFNAGMEKKIWFEETMLAMAQDTWQHLLVERYRALLTQLKQAIASS